MLVLKTDAASCRKCNPEGRLQSSGLTKLDAPVELHGRGVEGGSSGRGTTLWHPTASAAEVGHGTLPQGGTFRLKDGLLRVKHLDAPLERIILGKTARSHRQEVPRRGKRDG